MTPTLAERFANALASLAGKTIDPSGQIKALQDKVTADDATITDLTGKFGAATATLAIVGDVDKLTASVVALEALATSAGA